MAAAATARSGFRRMFSISAFSPPKPPTPPPKADPSPNLFISGTPHFLSLSPSSWAAAVEVLPLRCRTRFGRVDDLGWLNLEDLMVVALLGGQKQH